MNNNTSQQHPNPSKGIYPLCANCGRHHPAPCDYLKTNATPQTKRPIIPNVPAQTQPQKKPIAVESSKSQLPAQMQPQNKPMVVESLEKRIEHRFKIYEEQMASMSAQLKKLVLESSKEKIELKFSAHEQQMADTNAQLKKHILEFSKENIEFRFKTYEEQMASMNAQNQKFGRYSKRISVLEKKGAIKAFHLEKQMNKLRSNTKRQARKAQHEQDQLWCIFGAFSLCFLIVIFWVCKVSSV